MIGEDASSTFLQLIKQLIDISNTIAEGHYRRHANDIKAPKKPKIKVGQISKSDFKKLNEEGYFDFRHIAVPKDKLPDVEKALKELGGSYFVCRLEEGSNALIAVPSKQLYLANAAIKHVISDTLKEDPDAIHIHDGNEKLSEDLMNITSDILLDRDIPAYSFQADDGQYINIVPDEYEEQYALALNEAKKINDRISELEFTNFYQTEQLEDISYTAEEISHSDADKLYKAAAEYDIKADFVENGDKVIVKYSKDDTDRINKAKTDIEKQLADAEDYLVTVSDNSITMNIEKLLQSESETEYFFRVPNTGARDFIKLNKSECQTIDDGKTVTTKLDLEKSYAVFDSEGNFKSMRKGDELAQSYNTKNRYINMNTEVIKYGTGFRRIELFNRNRNRLISLDFDSAENIRKRLISLGIGKTVSDILLKNINEKMPDEYKENFSYTAEKSEIVYADIPNIGEYLAQAQLSQELVGKAEFCGERRSDSGFRCCVADNDSGKYTIIGTMPKAKMIEQFMEMGFEKLTAKQIADKILRDNPGFDSQDIENDEPRPKMKRFDTKNPEAEALSYFENKTGFSLVHESKDQYRYLDIDKGTPSLAVEKAIKNNITKDDISAAEIMRCLRDIGAVEISSEVLKNKTDGEIHISRLTGDHAEITHNKLSAVINKNKIDENALSDIGISSKGIASIRKSFERSKELSERKGKGRGLNDLKGLAHNAYNTLQEAKKNIAEHIPLSKTGDAR